MEYFPGFFPGFKYSVSPNSGITYMDSLFGCIDVFVTEVPGQDEPT